MPITIFNIFLCGLVCLWGVTVFACKKKKIGLLMSVAFLLFGISHLFSLADIDKNITGFVIIIVIRSIAYLVVIFGLDKLLRKK